MVGRGWWVVGRALPFGPIPTRPLPPPQKKKKWSFFLGGEGNFFLREGFNFELGHFYSAGIHFGASRIVGPVGWSIAFIWPVILDYEFQFSEF